ncbi:serine hydrolase domain-containing protein [Ruania albidiflava]|uniref:serine hydrolase domain-containing protein n=1 Tax=Ruania albidiflava TaxID=366586 RepID=UPI0003B3790F|nr:serine hydrolase [Ruania albidiflava]
MSTTQAMALSNGLSVAGTPDAAGVPSSAVLAVLDRLDQRGLNTHSLLIAHRGVLAFEGYWAPYTAQTPHRLYSASKSYVAVAIGTLVDDAALTLTDRLADHFPDKVPADMHPYVAAMTVEDLLTMRTAHAGTTYKKVDDPDWVRTFFTVPPDRVPGMVFSYDTSATVVLTALVERLSGQHLPEYLMDRVLGPIGVQQPVTALVSPAGTTAEQRAGRPTWREMADNPHGVAHGGSGLFTTPRDFLRFAQLCLQQGRWGGEQIVSAGFMQAATGYQTSTVHTGGHLPDSRCGYGYQFWRTRNGGFSARGMGGQIALCLPEEELVVVTTGDNQGRTGTEQAFFDAVWDELLPALHGLRADHPGDDDAPEAVAELERVRAGLALPPVPVRGGSHAEGGFTGRWAVDDQHSTFTTLAVSVGAHRGDLHLTDRAGQQRTFAFGIGALVRGKLPGYGYETLTSGAWLDEQTLYLRVHVLGLYLAQLELTLSVRGAAVTLTMSKAAEGFAQEYQGTVSGHWAAG